MRLPSLWRESFVRRWLNDDFEKAFDDFFGRTRLPAGAAAAFGFVPDADVIERDGEFVIRAELPGIAQEDLQVSMVGNALQIKGEKKTETEEKKENYYSSERTYGSFLRTIPLPALIDASRIEAKLDKGVLEVVCPKSEAAKPRKIEVKGEAKRLAEGQRPREERAREKA